MIKIESFSELCTEIETRTTGANLHENKRNLLKYSWFRRINAALNLEGKVEDENRNMLRLIPETENGDLSSINDPKNADLLRVVDYRMFTALEIEDQCPRKNKTANDDNTQYRVNSDAHFQDHIIDL